MMPFYEELLGADSATIPFFKELPFKVFRTVYSPDGWDEMSAVTGRVFVAQNPELFTYDADGNMLTDGRFRYTWNAENRLVRAQELCAPTNRNPYTIAYAYDHRGRMVSKRITENDGQDTLVKSIAYVWDGWNIIREIQVSGVRDQGSGETLVTDNVWGLDLDGTMQGAGGVGGLLAVIRSNSNSNSNSNSSLYFPTYDANGNISEYIDESGEVVAHYDYSPFGETLIEAGDLADTFTHRFSTKPWCPVTGLYEYQIRKYRPEIGRWLSRDPIGEKGGMNLFAYCANSLINNVDFLGRFSFDGLGRIIVAGVGGAISGALSGALSGGITGFIMAGPPGFAAGVTSGFVAGAAAGCISGMLSQVYNEIILPSDNLSQDAAFNNGLMSGMIAGTTAGAVAAAAEVSNLPAIGKCTQLKRSETRFKNIAFTKTSVNATMQATAAYLTSDGDLGYVTLSALLSISATHLELVAEEVSGTSAAGVILGIEFGFINAIGENYLYLFRDFR